MSLQDLFDHISNDDLEATKNLLAGGQVKVNDADEHGMSALQHASFKGLPKMCQMLLDQVSMACCHHKHCARLLDRDCQA